MYFAPLFGRGLRQLSAFGRNGAPSSSGSALLALRLPRARRSVCPSLFPLRSLCLRPESGLFKGNLHGAGRLSVPTESDRDAAFSRFYWAVNLGALPSGIVAGAWLSLPLRVPRGVPGLCFARDGAGRSPSESSDATPSCDAAVEQTTYRAIDSLRIGSRAECITILGPAARRDGVLLCVLSEWFTSLTLFAKYNTREPVLLGIPILPTCLPELAVPRWYPGSDPRSGSPLPTLALAPPGGS
jgi:hypothetical protein